jgi:eukaryotic-like serine/threonine-protein kinase
MVIAETQQSLAVGSVVAETYQVTRLLGRGGMGSVWEANHLRLPGKRVAIKVLHTDAASDQESLARFRREAEIATRLGHPNIVEVHDFNTLPGGHPYLVLELLVGESLDARMRRGPMAPDQVVRIAGQIAAALAAAHRAGVVHRDLKPQNVFLVPREDEVGGELVKVLDFGISKIRGSQTVKTQDSTILGTPQYMAPEQATGNHAAVDERTDVFALGAIVYEMLAGRPAFTGQNIPEVVYKVVYEQPAPLGSVAPGVAPRLVQAVERALAKKQEERTTDVAAFIEELCGMSISTLRRQPVVAMDAGDAAAADPLAATVDSGRRERTSIAPPLDATLRTSGRSRRGLWIGAAFALAAAATIVCVIALAPGAGDKEEAAAAPGPPPESGTAEDMDRLAVQATGEAFMAAREQAAAEAEEAELAHELGDERDDEDDEDAEDIVIPPAPPAPKNRTPLPGVRSMRPTDGESGSGEAPPAASADARSDLIAAETAFAAGDYREALYRAERAERDGAGPVAASVQARAHCATDNVGAAAAALRRIPDRRMQRMVRAFCASHGVELDE